jgi:hypothetical protein
MKGGDWLSSLNNLSKALPSQPDFPSVLNQPMNPPVVEVRPGIYNIPLSQIAYPFEQSGGKKKKSSKKQSGGSTCQYSMKIEDAIGNRAVVDGSCFDEKQSGGSLKKKSSKKQSGGATCTYSFDLSDGIGNRPVVSGVCEQSGGAKKKTRKPKRKSSN